MAALTVRWVTITTMDKQFRKELILTIVGYALMAAMFAGKNNFNLGKATEALVGYIEKLYAEDDKNTQS